MCSWTVTPSSHHLPTTCHKPTCLLQSQEVLTSLRNILYQGHQQQCTWQSLWRPFLTSPEKTICTQQKKMKTWLLWKTSSASMYPIPKTRTVKCAHWRKTVLPPPQRANTSWLWCGITAQVVKVNVGIGKGDNYLCSLYYSPQLFVMQLYFDSSAAPVFKLSNQI